MDPATDRYALVVCDVQPDSLSVLPAEERAALLDTLRTCVEAARQAGWLVVFSGLRFQSGYATVSARHRLYGGLQRLNAKMGDERVHWFMQGFAGAEIEPSLAPREGDAVVWRQRHLPSGELADVLRTRGITKATVVGLRASYSVQATCQALCDEGLLVYVVRECVQDDVPERLEATLGHILPIYAEVVGWADFLEGLGMESRVEELRAKACPATADGDVASGLQDDGSRKHFYCTDCKRGGHGRLFCEYLLERPDWRRHPEQKWFQDEFWKEYYCPLGKKVVDFADEPQFSRVAMYLRGRQWLEEKIRILEIAKDHMPETYVIECGEWKGAAPPPDDAAPRALWFVKQADRNWGTSIQCCLKPSECKDLTDPANQYVVQQHIPNPLLTEDGHKCHIKFYMLLICMEDGDRWSLYTYRDGYICISPNRWSPDDTSAETQVTILRNGRMSEVRCWGAWPDAYPKCKAAAAQVIGRAIEGGKLEGRPGQKQFEIFSADFVADTAGKVWLLEFNFDPVLKDESQSPDTNDSAMVRAALSIAMPWEQGSSGLWDLAGEFVGRPINSGAS